MLIWCNFLNAISSFCAPGNSHCITFLTQAVSVVLLKHYKCVHGKNVLYNKHYKCMHVDKELHNKHYKCMHSENVLYNKHYKCMHWDNVLYNSHYSVCRGGGEGVLYNKKYECMYGDKELYNTLGVFRQRYRAISDVLPDHYIICFVKVFNQTKYT